IGVVKQVQDLLTERDVATVVFDGTQPNPTISNVNDGLALLTDNECDFVVSLGGGSPHDCAKGIALVASNGGKIADYEGVDQPAKPMMPLI
ncbi:iron-containing alcohol dehydrogenase, partial [Salmonella enterica]|uniref:iron-containing alcohol dehydrogenase n=1 Tax=Salmonella enterica TaxID=28901 RepID=UPI003075BAF0